MLTDIIDSMWRDSDLKPRENVNIFFKQNSERDFFLSFLPTNTFQLDSLVSATRKIVHWETNNFQHQHECTEEKTFHNKFFRRVFHAKLKRVLENSTSTRFVAPQSLSDTELPATGARIRVSRNFLPRQTDRRPYRDHRDELRRKKNITKVERWFWDARAEITGSDHCVHAENHSVMKSLDFRGNSFAEISHQPRKSRRSIGIPKASLEVLF